MTSQSFVERQPGLIVIPAGLFGVYAAGLVLLSLVWPRYGQLPGLGLSPFNIMALLAWAFIPGILFLRRSFRARMLEALSGKGGIILLFLAWFAWRLLSSALGQTPAASINETMRDIVFLLPLLPAAMLLLTFPAGLRIVLRVIVLSAAIAIAVAFLERSTGQTIGHILGLGVSGGDALFATEMLRPSYRGGELRAKSTFYHPIVFAQFLAWSAPLLLVAIGSKIGRICKTIALACLVLLPAAIWFTGTRSGLIAVVASVGIYVVILLFQRTRLSVGAGFLVLALTGIVGVMLAGLTYEMFADVVSGRDSSEFSSTLTRLRMLDIGLSNVAHSPIFGYGDGRAAHFAGNFTGSSAFATIDNFYLSTLLNNGYVGFVLLAIAWVGLLYQSVRAALKLKRPIDSAVCAGVVAMLLTFSIVSLTDGLSFLLLSVALLALPLEPTERRSRDRPPAHLSA